MAVLPLFGYSPDRAATERFVSTLPFPTLATAGRELVLDETKDAFLGHALLKVNPTWKRGAQEIGSCVGWGWSLAVDMLAACDIVCRGESEEYGGDTLAASVYAFSRVEARGGKQNNGGDGSYGGAAAKAVTKYGTLHLNQDYAGQRFSESSGQLEKAWGRSGVPDKLEPFAAQHKVASVTLVRNFDEAAKAITNGYPVAICSSVGFKMTFAKDSAGRGGWLVPSGTWPHCQMLAGVFFGSRPGGIIPNSWADCYSGPVDESLPKPFQRSSGKVDADVIDRMLSGEDSFALAGFDGFKARSLPDWLGGVL